MNHIIIFDFNRTLYDPDHKTLIPHAQEILDTARAKGYTLVLLSKAGPDRELLVKENGLDGYFAETIFTGAKTHELFEQIAEHHQADKTRSYLTGNVWWLRIMGRLNPGVTREQAQAQLENAFQQSVVEQRAARQAAAAKQSGNNKIADLDPQNTTVRLKLAEGYLNEGMNAEAAAAFADHYDAVEGVQWSRPGIRSDGARFTVESFARYVIHDPIHHLFDVGAVEPGK